MNDLFETIVAEVPPPQVDRDAPFRMQVSTLAWSDYIGRIGCGRVLAGGLTGRRRAAVASRRAQPARSATRGRLGVTGIGAAAR